MTFPDDFPITAKWPPRYPERLQLYSLPTPNGVKVSILLEETGLPYEAHRVSFDEGDQKSPAFVSLNANGKIPAIIDPNGPGGAPIALSESGRSSSISPKRPDSSSRRTRPGVSASWSG